MSDDEGVSMLAASSSGLGTDEEQSDVVLAAHVLPPLVEVWDCDRIRLEEVEGKWMWTCLNCPADKQIPRAGKNATKLLYGHLMGLQGYNVLKCKGPIDPRYQRRYTELYARKAARKEQRKMGKAQLARAIQRTQETVVGGSVASSS